MVEQKRKAAIATVIDNQAIKRRFGRITILLEGEAAKNFLHVTPGQFAQIRLSEATLPQPDHIPGDLVDLAQRQILLRRPFSFYNVTVDKSTRVRVGILYCVLGPGTLRMTTLRKGDKVSIIGPLGNGFSVPPKKKYALLIAGGLGAPPLQHLASFIRTNFPKIQTIVFVGANTLDVLPFNVEEPQSNSLAISEFAKVGAESHICTDDGSAGFKGIVTQCLEQWLKESALVPADMIMYACGPEVMLAEVSRLSSQYDIDCQVSMERMMACGIGICQSCAVECKASGQVETKYKLCCKDGPVFDAREVVFERR